ncbi:ferritin-like domain-containing protein [Epilithonimonas sp. UC225_85]|uniref:YciE/YciF ferroxidase family protein n=1 Tax=Epilithonimonas sp. UC225_85 TaxID=3350167 RepID=UPI0036D27516
MTTKTQPAAKTATKGKTAAKTTATAATKKTPAKKDAAKELKDLFEDSLKDIYWAEKALVKALPKMHKNATDEKLKTAISDHLEQTKNHVTRLEDCFAALGKKAQAKKCDAMQGILDEGDSIVEETEPGTVRDAGIIAASQKVEHYEITTYGTLAAWAKVLKEDKCLENLLATLEEEKKCDELLTGIADTNLNSKAL